MRAARASRRKRCGTAWSRGVMKATTVGDKTVYGKIAGELQQDQLAAQQFAFLGGPWETHAQETEKANTAVTQALPQAAQGLRGDAMRDYAEGIDGRYGDPDGLLGWLGERADSAGQGLLSGAARILGVPGAGTAMDFLSTMENAAQQARENGAGEDEAFLYGLGEVVKRIGGQQLEEYFRSKAGELFTRGEVQAMNPREISENYDAIRESMSLWDKDGRLPESMPERDVVDSQSPAGDNGGNASAELNAESARRENADRAENIIPNVGNASIDSRKLTDYALNPEHPVMRGTAQNPDIFFQSALGYNKSNAEEFMQQIYEKLPGGRATLGKLDEFGQRYTVDISITGPNGNTVEVRTGWIIKKASDTPALTTIFVK